MGKTRKNESNMLKGVSTLDAIGKKLKVVSLLFIILILSNVLYAARGHSTLDLVDPTFNPDIQTSSFGAKSVHAVTPLPNGKVLVGGLFSSYNRERSQTLVRLNSDGSIDPTFGTEFETITGHENQVLKIALQSDGKIIVSLANYTINGQSGSRTLVRLNSDGSLDKTFNYTEDYFPHNIAIDTLDRIILLQSFASEMIRLNPDGSLDTSFQFATNLPAIFSFALQNNKIITSHFRSSSIPPTIRRFNEDGSVDNTFTIKNLSFGGDNIIIQPDSKILVLERNSISRLNEDGDEDDSFTNINLSSRVIKFDLTIDGKIYVLTDLPITLRRFLSDGNVDNSFTPYIYPQPLGSFIGTFGIETDSSVIFGDVLSGTAKVEVPNGFIRILSDGSLDNTFNEGGIGFQNSKAGSIWTITVQSDEKIVIGGRFDYINNSERLKMARLNSDSSLDPTFQINASGEDNSFTQISNIYHIVEQNDGKLLVSGHFTYLVNGETKMNLVRLNSDGSIDSTFNINIEFIDTFGCCGSGGNKPAPIDNNELYVANSRLSNMGGNVPVKLNADGTVNTSFDPNIYPSSGNVFINDLIVLPDGKLLISGTKPINGRKGFVIRINTDGSIDQTFQTNEIPDTEIGAMNLLSNGKFLAVLTHYNPGMPPFSEVIRFNSDGSLDNSFEDGSGADGKIHTILSISTGKILVGGDFSTFNNQPRQYLAQLNADGNLTQLIYSLNEQVRSLAIDKLGRVLVGGDFTVINTSRNNSSTRSYLARLIDSRFFSTRLDFNGDGLADLGTFNDINGIWDILNSETNQSSSTQFGLNGDRIVAADFDGDSETDIAIYRPSEGKWYLNQTTDGFSVIRWGIAEDVPIPSDFDGDQKADFALWRPSTGTWYILQNSDYKYTILKFGLSEDIPLQDADFDGDNKADIAVWRPSNGNFYWLESGSRNQFKSVHFGQTGDIPAIGDYNGDAKTDLVVFRPSEGVWYQYLTDFKVPYKFKAIQFGQAGDEPVAADYDGDGETDIAIRRQNVWHLLLSETGYRSVTFGNPQNKAIAALSKKINVNPNKIGKPLNYRNKTSLSVK